METDMGACTVSSIADLTSALLEKRGSHLYVKHSASDDIAKSLLAKASQLHTDGMRVFVVCADDVAQSRYRLCLRAFPNLLEEHILTMRELCSRTLARAEVQQTLKRGSRVLDDNEHDVLLEDLKTSGIRPRRLREMLKFFYRNFSYHTDGDESWLLTAEERALYALLKENLKARKAVLPCEMASLACRGLRESEADIKPAVAIVDSYDTLSRASQCLLDILFPSHLIVAGSASGARGCAEPYPNPEGFLSFCDTRAAVERVELTLDQPVLKEVHTTFIDPATEFTGIAAAIANHLLAGIPPRDILVAVPNPTWGHRVIAQLAQKNIRATLDTGVSKVEGDPRNAACYANLRLATFFKLFLNPDDLVSLRSWLGFGDWLLRSDAFLDLMAFAQTQKQDMRAALDELRELPPSQHPFTSFEKFVAPLAELDELLQACANISLKDAIALFKRHKMELDARMIEMLGADPKCADIANLAHHAFETQAPSDEETLIVAPYQRCHGRHARVTFLTGFINGFLPSLDAVDDRYTIDHRNSALSRERKVFETVRATASEMLVYSYFQSDRIVNAEKMRMQTTRLFIKDATRYAKVAPSVFLPVEQAVSSPAAANGI
jgi:hypothetical protein